MLTPEYGDVGCDLYAPRINIRDAAGGASLPAQWFTSVDQLNRCVKKGWASIKHCHPRVPLC